MWKWRVGHFTVIDGNEAEVDLVLIQRFLLSYVYHVVLMLNENLSSIISIRKQMRSASKQGQTQPGINPKTVRTKPTSVKWYIICCPFIRCQFYLSPSTSRLYDAGNLHHIASVEVRFQGWYVFRLVSIFRLQTPVWPLSQGIFQQCVRCTRQAPVGRQLCPVIRMNYAPNAVYHLKTTASHEEARKAFFFCFLEASGVPYDLQGNLRILKVNVGDLWKAWAFLWTPYCIQQLTGLGGSYPLYFFRLQTVQFCNYIQTPHHGHRLNTVTSLMITDSFLRPWGKPLHFL